LYLLTINKHIYIIIVSKRYFSFPIDVIMKNANFQATRTRAQWQRAKSNSASVPQGMRKKFLENQECEAMEALLANPELSKDPEEKALIEQLRNEGYKDKQILEEMEALRTLKKLTDPEEKRIFEEYRRDKYNKSILEQIEARRTLKTLTDPEEKRIFVTKKREGWYYTLILEEIEARRMLKTFTDPEDMRMIEEKRTNGRSNKNIVEMIF